MRFYPGRTLGQRGAEEAGRGGGGPRKGLVMPPQSHFFAPKAAWPRAGGASPQFLSPPRSPWEPARLQSPPGGPGLDGGAPPGRLHQPHRVAPSLVEGPSQQPADGGEIGEIPLAQVFWSRKSRLKGKTRENPAFPGVFSETRGAHRPWGWPRASPRAPGPPARCRREPAPRRRGGPRGSERPRRAPGWRWQSRRSGGM